VGVRTLTEYIGKLKGPRSQIVNDLRRLIKKTVPGVQESIKWAQPVYEKNGPFCYISAHTDHIQLGFWRGAELDDPGKLLVGSDGQMRHVEIMAEQVVPEEALQKLIRDAASLNEEKGNPVTGG